mmetsp:Transcript_92892/g.220841  ORF Transcript_92892/g.220841 Transcript_92892/m.220841 type:complete len:253 (+) Transcript_92892:1057-1815(+)
MDSSCAAMPSQRSSRSLMELLGTWAEDVTSRPSLRETSPSPPWMCSSNSAARARVCSLWGTPLLEIRAARFPLIWPSLAPGGLAAQSKPSTNGAKSTSSSIAARRAREEAPPSSALPNCGSLAASGRSKVPWTIFRASERWVSWKSPPATMPAKSTAPSSEQLGVEDRSSVWSTLRPTDPGCAKADLVAASQASHSNLATNSWHLALCTRSRSCTRPPRFRNWATRAGKRSPSRATTTFKAGRTSSSAFSSF